MKYNPRIGQLIVEFLEFFRKHEEESVSSWDLDEALRSFGEAESLQPMEIYQMAVQLYSQSYPLDPVEFHPDYLPENDENIPTTDIKQHTIFDEYKNALARQDYNKAHIIFESMTADQKQLIRDRRAKMEEKIKKQAQAEAALQKEVPVAGPKAEDVPLREDTPTKEIGELAELIGPAEDLIDNYNSLNLPPESMKVFLPFGHALDEFKHVRDESTLGKMTREELRQKTEAFLSNYGKVLKYLEAQGYEIAELKALLQKYANLFFMQPTASVTDKILALASKLNEHKMSDIAKRLISATTEEGWRDFEEAWENIESPKTLVEAPTVDSANPIQQFTDLLQTGKYAEARELYLSKLTPVQREQADDIARLQFTASNLVTLQKVGQSLFDKGKYIEANEVRQIIKAQFAELPPTDQKRVILLILPDGEELPQGFENIKDTPCGCGCGMQDKLQDMQHRLNPMVAMDMAQKLLRLADNLDEKGQEELADKLTNWVQNEIKQAQVQNLPAPQTPKREVGVQPCPLCGQDIFYDKAKGRPPFCPNCGKGTWGAGTISKAEKIPGGLAKGKKDDEFDKEQLEKGIEVEYEHTHDKETAKEIAKDHLTENKDYYKHLEKMEKKMDKEAAAKDEHGGKPAKVVEIADAIRRDNPEMGDEVVYRQAWETFCSYVNPDYEGCTEKGKSKRESPKSEYAK